MLDIVPLMPMVVTAGFTGFLNLLDARNEFHEKNRFWGVLFALIGAIPLFICVILAYVIFFLFCPPSPNPQQYTLWTFILWLFTCLFWSVAASGLFYGYRYVFKSKLLCSWFRKMEPTPEKKHPRLSSLAHGAVMTLIFILLNAVIALAYGFVLTNWF